jgi:NTE family protein
MTKQLAFVLSGGGARGALQAGALRALVEADIRPDLLVGTSAGAINATFVALRGMNLTSIEMLVRAWRDAATSEILTANYVWVTLSSLFNRRGKGAYHRMRDFFIAHGLAPTLRFGNIQGVRLFVVAADLNCGCPVVYGTDPQQSVLEAVLASAALPPWVPPIEKDGQLLIDGGAVSSLPIEAALAQGAMDIIALDLTDSREIPPDARGWLPLIAKIRNMAEQRQMELELALAEARGVPVRRIVLRAKAPVEVWDFRRADELVERGYEITRQEMAQWPRERPMKWTERLQRFLKTSNVKPHKEKDSQIAKG